MGLPRWLSGEEHTCQYRRLGFNPWVEKIPWRGKRQSTPVFLPRESHGQRSLEGYSTWNGKESDMTERAHTDRQTHTHEYSSQIHFWPTRTVVRIKSNYVNQTVPGIERELTRRELP